MHICKLVKPDVKDAPYYVCRAEDDQDGQKCTNLMVKDTLVHLYAAFDDLVALLEKPVNQEEDRAKEGDRERKETPTESV